MKIVLGNDTVKYMTRLTQRTLYGNNVLVNLKYKFLDHSIQPDLDRRF